MEGESPFMREEKETASDKDAAVAYTIKSIVPAWKSGLVLLLFAFVFSWQMEFAWRNNLGTTWGFMVGSLRQFLLATALVFMILLIFKVLIRKIEYVILFGGTFLILIAFLNYFKLTIRNEPVLPWDIMIIREAFAIMPSNGKMEIKYNIFIHIFLLLFWFFAVKYLPVLLRKKRLKKGEIREEDTLSDSRGKRRKGRRSIRKRSTYFMFYNIKIRNLFIIRFLLKTGLVVVLVWGVLFYATHVFMNERFIQKFNIFDNEWAQIESCQKNGFVTSFLINCKYFHVKKPADYSENKIDQVVDAISAPANRTEDEAETTDTVDATSADSVSEKRPNVIIIMNESFIDGSLFTEVKTSEAVTPTLEKLKETGVTGTLLTPQFGGGTANSEFEVLTGLTLANLPTGSTPYQQFIKQPLLSYPGFMTKHGYYSLAIHPFERYFWNRDHVYSYLGFHDFYGMETFENPEITGKFISDREAMKKIISEYEKNKSEEDPKPFFNFTVTIQNHFPYSALDYKEDHLVQVAQAPCLTEESKQRLSGYLTGLRDADRALQFIMDYFAQEQEPTIIVFFGDHLGSWGDIDESYEKSGYMNGDLQSAENIKKAYSTPFVIWSNFKETHEDAGAMEMYQLLPYMTHLYDLPRPVFFDYLLEQSQYYKGFVNNMYLDPEGNPIEGDPGPEITAHFQKHRLLQYDLLMGERYGEEKLYKEAAGK